MKFFIYGKGDGIDKIKEELKNPEDTYESIKEVFEEIKRRYDNLLDIDDLSIKYYCYDARIKKDVYMVVTNKCGKENYIEKYKYPQYVSYLISI